MALLLLHLVSMLSEAKWLLSLALCSCMDVFLKMKNRHGNGNKLHTMLWHKKKFKAGYFWENILNDSRKTPKNNKSTWHVSREALILKRRLFLFCSLSDFNVGGFGWVLVLVFSPTQGPVLLGRLFYLPQMQSVLPRRQFQKNVRFKSLVIRLT